MSRCWVLKFHLVQVALTRLRCVVVIAWLAPVVVTRWFTFVVEARFALVVVARVAFVVIPRIPLFVITRFSFDVMVWSRTCNCQGKTVQEYRKFEN